MESDFTLEARSHVMIDLETLDTSPTAKILSIGASFDIPILINHYSELGVTHRSERPWNFWDECCMRTAISQTEEKIDKTEGIVHNALDDAVRQGRFLQSELGSTFLLNMERKAWLKKKEEDSEGII